MTLPKIPLSVFIITQDEADRISHAVLSVRDWADEVIVVDSGSQDNTVQLAESLGAKVLYHPFEGYGPQKRYAESQCTHKWVLNIDADEEVTPELAQEIISLYQSGKFDNSLFHSYWVYRQEIFMHQAKAIPFTEKTKWLRLYHRDYARFQDCNAHDFVVVEKGKTGTLKHSLLHRSLRSWHHFVEKLNAYTNILAKVEFEKGKKPSAVKIVITPVFYFFKMYVLKRYFLYGVNGFVLSYAHAFTRLLKYIKTRELFTHSKAQKDI